MESSGSPAPPAEGDPSPDASKLPPLPEVINIAETGDLILDVTFENSRATLRSVRQLLPRASSSSSSSSAAPHPHPHPPPRGHEPRPAPRPRVRAAFRVDLGALRRQSQYFDRLLGDARFREAKEVGAALAALLARGVSPGAAAPADLPRVAIHDDDEATRYAHRDAVFADLLRVLHGRAAASATATAQVQVTMTFVATLAVLADRFDCAAAVSKYLTAGLKFKWPVTSRRPVGGGSRDEPLGPAMSRNAESVLRQKILVSWLLNQPGKFQAATRELIMNGSCRWSSFGEEEGEDETTDATWWYLQDGLEQELQYRRHCILNTIASVQRHFLALYTSRGSGSGAGAQQQCKLGYESSAACDSYQLGEMVRFLAHRRLLSLVDFSPASLGAVADADADGAARLLPVDALLAALRQCPAYQVDKNHSNCGLRTRLLPILDFVQALLSAGSVPLSRAAWREGRRATAWMPEADGDGDGDSRPFRFTRSMAGDQRLRYENAMGADKFAREVFTATSWDWTAEDQGPDRISSTPRWSWK